MKAFIHPKRQKSIIVAIAALVSIFGLESGRLALDLYQIDAFFLLAFAVYGFLLFWQSFIFDLHLKNTGGIGQVERSIWRGLKDRFHYMIEPKHCFHYQNYLILPGTIFWASVALLFLNPFNDVIKQAVIVFSGLALTVSYWHLKAVFYEHKTTSHLTRQTVMVVKLYASYLAFVASFGVVRYFGYEPLLFSFFAAAVTALLFYQALFQYCHIDFLMVKILISVSVLMGLLAFAIFGFWNANYFSGALALTAVYNTVWGLVHHKFIDEDLTRKIASEYLGVMIFILVILFSTTNFAERI